MDQPPITVLRGNLILIIHATEKEVLLQSISEILWRKGSVTKNALFYWASFCSMSRFITVMQPSGSNDPVSMRKRHQIIQDFDRIRAAVTEVSDGIEVVLPGSESCRGEGRDQSVIHRMDVADNKVSCHVSASRLFNQHLE